MISFNLAEKGYEVDVRATEIGNDTLVIIYGGDRPHIGSVVLAYGFKKSSSKGTITSTTVPGHKEEELIREPAEIIARHTEGTVVVVGGVHYEELDKEGIDIICDLGIRAAERIIDSSL